MNLNNKIAANFVHQRKEKKKMMKELNIVKYVKILVTKQKNAG